MESISMLLFKPGFTIAPLDDDYEPSVSGIDDQLVWKSGISIMEARNHYHSQYDPNRISLIRLMIVLLSQPLFHAPDEYLVILNPFSTYLTNRRCKNVKNLFVSLINFVVSYDCAGYVSRKVACSLRRLLDCYNILLLLPILPLTDSVLVNVYASRASLTLVRLTRRVIGRRSRRYLCISC